ncbi:MAG: mechanosensitive ion channel [Ideonella sp.]|nr:mechanosensitive ion channel [Ideonella sp.]MBL0148136.1 mechanosensitive ion channel [Ideonella sp.]
MQVIDSLPDLFDALTRPAALAELAVLVACTALAWGIVRLARRDQTSGILFGERGFDGVLFPLLMLGLTLLARWLLVSRLHLAVLKLAVPILASLALIRVIVRVLHVAFPKSLVVRALERTVSWLVWIGLVLWLTDLLPLVLAEMEAMRWHIAGSSVSLRSLVEGALSAVVVLVLMLWLSASIEARLMAADSVNLSVRKIMANATRALLLLVGLLLALSAAGIPLGALSVLGGAAGVGIGLGLQKLAANYVSGFVILAERSLRIGDMVKVDNFEGRITDITTRYTVIRAQNGRESIVPNELLVTQRVENSSFADPKVAMTTVVQVAYGTDLAAVMPSLAAAVQAVQRVLADPAPAVQLSQFAADGLELTIVYWIADLENGQGNVRSDVNLAVLAALTTAGVEIPFPQRVMHAVPAQTQAAQPPANA